jgi:SAM-dependent methyltransferase
LEIVLGLPVRLEGKVALDFGCKFGHVLPVFLALGAERAIGVDVEPDYLEAGRKLFGALYPGQVDIVPSVEGLIAIQPCTVDFVFMNEVISHINPCYLDRVYSEVARVLRPGGAVFISDGNNAAHPAVREKLASLWATWENGPDGTATDRDVVDRSYLTERREFIASRWPSLADERPEEISRNTSGLFGHLLAQAVDHAVETGEIVRRPYRTGVCPTYPLESGAVIERCVHPLQVVLALAEHGIDARLFSPKQTLNWKGKLYNLVRGCLMRLASRDWRLRASEGFQILGVRR